MWNKQKWGYETVPQIENFFDNYLNEPQFVDYKLTSYIGTNNHYLSADGKFLYISYLFGYSTETNTLKYSDNLHSQSSLMKAYNNAGYLDFFVDVLQKNSYDLTKIQYIKVNYVDRGIPDFKAFGNMLKTLFPNLKRLFIGQNFIPDGSFNDYLYMLDLLQLDKFIIDDRQSSGFDNINTKSIFNVIKEGSLYIQIHMNRDVDGDVKSIDNNIDIECQFHRIGGTKILLLNHYDFEKLNC